MLPTTPTPLARVLDTGAVRRFDERVDLLLERARGHRLPDAVFTTASELGDFSLIWHLANTSRGVFGGRVFGGRVFGGRVFGSSRHADQAFLFAGLLGVESLIVNQGIKRFVGRTRPTTSGDPRLQVRAPSTSSFPSGHASAGFFTASVLTAMGPRRIAPLWFGLAGIVSVSRAYVRIHHASDVIGGAAVGLALAAVVRRSGMVRP